MVSTVVLRWIRAPERPRSRQDSSRLRVLTELPGALGHSVWVTAPSTGRVRRTGVKHDASLMSSAPHVIEDLLSGVWIALQ